MPSESIRVPTLSPKYRSALRVAISTVPLTESATAIGVGSSRKTSRLVRSERSSFSRELRRASRNAAAMELKARESRPISSFDFASSTMSKSPFAMPAVS